VRGVANVALLLAAASCTAFGTAAVRDGAGSKGEQEGSGGGEKGEPRDEVSVGEVVEVGQSGGKGTCGRERVGI